MVKTRIRHCQRVASNEGKTTTAKIPQKKRNALKYNQCVSIKKLVYETMCRAFTIQRDNFQIHHNLQEQ